MSETINLNEAKIIEGWAILAEEFEHRELNPTERLQVERAEAVERITEKYGLPYKVILK